MEVGRRTLSCVWRSNRSHINGLNSEWFSVRFDFEFCRDPGIKKFLKFLMVVSHIGGSSNCYDSIFRECKEVSPATNALDDDEANVLYNASLEAVGLA